jgi:ribosomal protein L5
MDGIKVSNKKVVEFMEYVEPCYNYKNWMQIVQYKKVCVGMHYQKNIYNGKKMMKGKDLLCTLMESQKQ